VSAFADPQARLAHGPLGYNRGFWIERIMDAERLNQIENLISDLRQRVGELRRYL
jgi:hypothetical protein